MNAEREQRVRRAIFEAVCELRGLQEILDEDREPAATDRLPNEHVGRPREIFNDDALRRLVRAEEGYCRSHGHYIPSLAAYLLNERVRLREREQQLREAREERDKALHQRDNFERIAQEQAERAHRLWLRVNDLEQADVALGEGAKG